MADIKYLLKLLDTTEAAEQFDAEIAPRLEVVRQAADETWEAEQFRKPLTEGEAFAGLIIADTDLSKTYGLVVFHIQTELLTNRRTLFVLAARIDSGTSLILNFLESQCAELAEAFQVDSIAFTSKRSGWEAVAHKYPRWQKQHTLWRGDYGR